MGTATTVPQPRRRSREALNRAAALGRGVDTVAWGGAFSGARWPEHPRAARGAPVRVCAPATPTALLQPRPRRPLPPHSRGVSTRQGALHPLWRVKKAGSSSAPKAATGTPCVSRNSRVRGMSSTLGVRAAGAAVELSWLGMGWVGPGLGYNHRAAPSLAVGALRAHRLGAGADHRHGGAAQLGQVCRHVHGRLPTPAKMVGVGSTFAWAGGLPWPAGCFPLRGPAVRLALRQQACARSHAPVHAADAARDKHADPGARRQQHGRADSGGAVRARCHRERQVPAGDLLHRRPAPRDALNLLPGQACVAKGRIPSARRRAFDAAGGLGAHPHTAGTGSPGWAGRRAEPHPVRAAPTQQRPPMMAIVAGTAPPALTTPSTARAVSRFWG